MIPVREQRDHTVRPGLQGIQDEFGLPTCQVNDPGASLWNRIAEPSQVVIHEQVRQRVDHGTKKKGGARQSFMKLS